MMIVIFEKTVYIVHELLVHHIIVDEVFDALADGAITLHLVFALVVVLEVVVPPFDVVLRGPFAEAVYVVGHQFLLHVLRQD